MLLWHLFFNSYILLENKVTMKRQKEFFFATVEGGEGVGKSSFIKKLSEALLSLSVDHTLTREPGGSLIAEKLREIFNDPNPGEILTIEAEFLLVSAARAQHVKNLIQPQLASKKSILCDRFIDSSRVYQGTIGGLTSRFIEEVSEACSFSLKPNITFLLDCDPVVSMARLDKRELESQGLDKKTRYDQKAFDFHKKVRDGFLELAKVFPERIKVLDASKNTDQIVADAVEHLKGFSLL